MERKKKLVFFSEDEIIRKHVSPLLSPPEPGEALKPLDDVRDFFGKGERIVVNIDGGDIGSMKYPWRTYADVGWAAVIGALSDHVVKGSIPYAILVSLGVDPDWDIGDFSNLLEGIYAAVKEYNIRYLGGDINSSKKPWITVSAIGFTSAKKLPSRDGAKPGDKIIVVGKYGASGVIALHGLHYAMNCPWIIDATQRPEIRIELASIVEKHYRVIHASMDVSDGLGYTIYTLSVNSGIRSILYEKPLHYGELEEICRRRLDPEKCIWETILSGGEEYGGVFYVDSERLDDFIEDLERYNIPYKVVGEAVKSKPGVSVEGIDSVEVSYWDQFIGWRRLVFKQNAT